MALLTEGMPVPAGGPGAAAEPPGLRHVAALDGLRGLAVAGVVAFHLGWIDGGYLGVDAFFVLSGFLITSLLVVEHDGTGTIGLRRFWSRRARRLLPAMLVVVAVVLLWAMLEAPSQLATIRGDAVATLLYVANWHEIATSADYWAIFRTPSPLQHAWSLAIEEQFYLVWPLLVMAVGALAARLRRPLAHVLGPVALAVAVASYVLMAVLYRAGDVSRAYYGTETRIGAIALGAALAVLLRRRPGPRTGRGRAVLDGAGLVALVGLGLAWAVLAGTTPWLYRGGFVLLGLGVVVVIAAVVQPESVLARAVSWAPLRGLGLISYGLYLWHWVVIATLTPARTGLSGLALDAVQLAVSFAAALASYWYLEQPIRRRRWLAGGRSAVPAALGAYGAVFSLVAASTLVPAPGLDGLATALEGRADAVAVPVTTSPAGTAPEAAAGPATVAPTTIPATTVPLPPARVGVFGDSTAMMTGMGLHRYGQHTGAFDVVVNDGRVGCGIDQGGERRYRGRALALDNCGDLFEQWTGAVAGQPIDVAVVQTGQWEVVEHKLVGDTEWRTIGDPTFDRYLLGQLEAVNTFWVGRGIPVVWLRAPIPAYLDRDPGPMVRFNELVEEAAGSPSVTTVALDTFVGGLSATERAALRPDGVHFDEETSALVAETWLGPQVAQAIDGVRRVTPPAGSAPVPARAPAAPALARAPR